MQQNEKEGVLAGKKAWEEKLVAKALSKGGERRETFSSSSGITVDRLYTPADLTDFSYEEKLGYPGQYPFTRGIQPTMYRGRFWTMRQYAGFATAEESNQRYKYLLEQGQTGLSIAFDLPTQIGYDSDDPIAHGEVGKVGVAIDSLADMEVLFRDIPLDKVSSSMTINAPAGVLLAFYIAAAEKQGVSPDLLAGTIQNDILKEYSARGTYIFPPAPSMRLITNIFEYCSKSVPKWNTISISGYHIREAGSTAAQEVAFTLADGIAYVEAAIAAGMDVDDFAGRLSFFFNAHNDLLEEVAKYRAARRLWAKIMRERFHAKSDRSCMLRFHTQTGGSTLTAQQPDNNIVRGPPPPPPPPPPCDPDPGRGDGRDPVPAHELTGRGAGPSHRGLRAHRAADAADRGVRIRRGRHDRPAGRFLLRGEPHRQDRGDRAGIHREDRRDGRRGEGH
jgi:methylmalonyl-CoA mutase N-terminal domain/subunit